MSTTPCLQTQQTKLFKLKTAAARRSPRNRDNVDERIWRLMVPPIYGQRQTDHEVQSNARNSNSVKLVTNASQWHKIRTRGRRRKGRIVSFAGNSERQGFVCSRYPLPKNQKSVRLYCKRNERGSLPPCCPSCYRPCCPPQPPDPCVLPPKPPKDERLFWMSMALLCAAGGMVVYAKRDPEFRCKVSGYIPYFNTLVAVVFQENQTYGETLCKISNWFAATFRALYKAMFKPKSCPPREEPCKKRQIEESAKESSDSPEKEKEKEPSVCDNYVEIATKDIMEITKYLKETVEAAVGGWAQARDATVNYNNCLDFAMSDFKMARLADMRDAQKNRDKSVPIGSAAAKEYTKKIENFMCCLTTGLDVPQSVKDAAFKLINEHLTKIRATRKEFEDAYKLSLMNDILLQKVETLMNKFTSEVSNMYPEINYETNLHIKGDPDLLVFHTYKYVMEQLEEACSVYTNLNERINKEIFRSLPQDDAKKKERDRMIEGKVGAKKGEMDAEYNKRLAGLKQRTEEELKEKQKSILAENQKRLDAIYQKRYDELFEEFNRIVTQKVNLAKASFDAELADMQEKLEKLQQILEDQLRREKENEKARCLWAAAAGLLAATQRGGDRVSIKREIKAIRDAAGDDDKLVAQLLKAIPCSVRQRGVVPESTLRRKFPAILALFADGEHSAQGGAGERRRFADAHLFGILDSVHAADSQASAAVAVLQSNISHVADRAIQTGFISFFMRNVR
ncbi:MICOS complex subunit Mic60 [Eumeta japonica]|uniref:MICOS complex subunit MIC60 n=1 Tax=Eumeta variegata TaxID=151549 RepID=A0A4C1V224_EUMVA|nr:MICOS complex subunit Mic60 [Eumeta japonica]